MSSSLQSSEGRRIAPSSNSGSSFDLNLLYLNGNASVAASGRRMSMARSTRSTAGNKDRYTKQGAAPGKHLRHTLPINQPSSSSYSSSSRRGLFQETMFIENI